MNKTLLLLILLFATSAKAQQETTPLRFTFYDYPFNQDHNTYNFPSMRQALDTTTSFYNFAHEELELWAMKNEHQSHWYNVIFDIVWASMPLGTAWLHEEYHRAVLSAQRISSYNDVYNMAFTDVIAVSHLSDTELSEFKKDNNPSFVRMSTAGMEAQLDMNLRISQDYFFLAGPTNRFNQLLNTVNVSFYMHACTNSDERIDKIIEADGSDMDKRDFTGFDCLAWVYDLHRPNESYSARGSHPSGVGIDRYIKYSDLTRKEKDYLQLNVNLSMLNFINPMMYGYKEFGKENEKWNYSFSHYMTSFGHTVDINGFFKKQSKMYQLTLHNYFNEKRNYLGLEGILFDHPLIERWSADLRSILWAQPKGQSFYTKNSAIGGLMSGTFKYHYKKNHFPFIELEQKTQGWVAGNVYLDPAFSTRLGYLIYY